MPEERVIAAQLPSPAGPSSASGTATPPGPPIARIKKKKSIFSLNSRSNSASNVSNANNSSTTSGFGKLRGRSHLQPSGVPAGKIPRTPNTNSETSGSSTGGFFRRVSALFSKIRAISDEVFASDEVLEELFSDSGSSKTKRWETNTEAATEIARTGKPMYKISSASSSGRGTTLNSKSAELESIIEDILKQHQRISPASRDEAERDDGIRTLVDEADAVDGPSLDVYDVDFNQLRDELIKRLGKDSSQVNVGELIWDYRKTKWLVPTKTPDEIASHVARNTLGHVARESYAKIYSHLVVKNSPLRKGKAINLSDLVTIIDAGWIVEEKYERAAIGLP